MHSELSFPILTALVLMPAVGALVIGLGGAWVTTRTDLAGRRVWTVLLALPLVFPSYVGALAIVGAFGPEGIVSGALGLGGL